VPGNLKTRVQERDARILQLETQLIASQQQAEALRAELEEAKTLAEAKGKRIKEVQVNTPVKQL
jgi:predicted RNase H-like nuclease (RuvC/YqgF family)